MINDQFSSGNSVIVHEMAHSWFGGYVTSENWTDYWFSNGFATYLERLAYRVIADTEYSNI